MDSPEWLSSKPTPLTILTAELAWVEMRWLYSVIVYLLFKGLGLNGLILLKLLLLGLTFYLLGRYYRGSSRWVVFLGLSVTLAATHNRFFIRPELISYLFLVLYLFCLYRYKAGGTVRWLVPLPFLQVLWTNSHTLFNSRAGCCGVVCGGRSGRAEAPPGSAAAGAAGDVLGAITADFFWWLSGRPELVSSIPIF